MTLLAGVDAGASRCEAVVAGPTLEIRARRRGTAAAVAPGDVEGATSTVVQVVGEAVADSGLPGPLGALVVGAAGAGRESERVALESSLQSQLGRHVKIAVTTDVAVALEDGFPDRAPGILVIAGSGSVALARDHEGRTWQSGGLGWQLGDEGSGYALGRAALGSVGRAADGRGPPTALSARIGTQTQTTSLEQLVRWAQTADRRTVAGLAIDVCHAAADGDDVADRLVRDAAAALVQHVAALLTHFSMTAGVRVALAGGLLTPGSAVRSATLASLGSRFPRLVVSHTPVDPARGALRMAAPLLA